MVPPTGTCTVKRIEHRPACCSIDLSQLLPASPLHCKACSAAARVRALGGTLSCPGRHPNDEGRSSTCRGPRFSCGLSDHGAEPEKSQSEEQAADEGHGHELRPNASQGGMLSSGVLTPEACSSANTPAYTANQAAASSAPRYQERCRSPWRRENYRRC